MDDLNNRTIEIVGAEANNLKGVNVSFPIGEISMVVGVSGSGKSSLLSETLAREGNDRLGYFLDVRQDHLPLSTHQAFIGAMPPSLHIGQKAFRASSRTTVGTSSGILMLLRRLFLHWSQPIANNNEVVTKPTSVAYQQWIENYAYGRVTVWAIPLSFVKSDGVEMARRMLDLGMDDLIVRSETDSPQRWEAGRKVSTNAFKPLSKQTRHVVEACAGHVDLSQWNHKKMLQSLLQLAFEAGEGKVFIELPDTAVGFLDSRSCWVSPDDPCIYHPPNNHLLSFNAPDHPQSGACKRCKGLGWCTTLDLKALITHPDRSMHQGALSLWTEKNYKHVNIQHTTIEGLRGVCGFDPDIPWCDLGEEAKQMILEGLGSELITDIDPVSKKKVSKPHTFPGFRSAILARIAKRGQAGERLGFLAEEEVCPGCQGTRWSEQARALKINHYSIDEILELDFSTLTDLCVPGSHLTNGLSREAQAYFKQIHHLASSFVGVGLGHLNAARGMTNISGGEARRLRLAAVLDGRHRGLCLLLDEPARGLHDEDVDRLVTTLRQHHHVHTLILNEHRYRVAAAADFFVEIGPGAGSEGGNVVYAGKVPKSWSNIQRAFKRQQLSVNAKMPMLTVKGASLHNLQGVDVSIPLGRFVCLVGVSGSGKSSFVQGVLVPALLACLSTDSTESDLRHGRWATIKGAEKVSGLVVLDQNIPAANRRSTLTTFMALAEPLRRLYAKQPSAKSLGLQTRDFSLNSGNGRCQQCLGIGELEDRSHWMTCPSCGGLGFGQRVLTVKVDEQNIAQLLGLTISELVTRLPNALSFASQLLQTIEDLGIGHLSLGRRLDTLSGGELQRLRIAKELTSDSAQPLVFVLDEPAAGLHYTDVSRLLRVFERIVDKGHTIIAVEHNLELAASSDWLIEFGPGGGAAGGEVVAYGTPQQLRQCDTPSGRMLSQPGKATQAKIRNTIKAEKENFVDSPLSLEEAQTGRRWLRRLLGDDVAPQEQDLYCEGERLVVAIEKPPSGRLLEYGAIECELAAFMMEYDPAKGRGHNIEHMVDMWRSQQGAELCIHPLINEIYTWGAHIPRSIQQSRYKQLTQNGLAINQNLALDELRAIGGPLSLSPNASDEQRQHRINFALLTGGGYVELCEGDVVIASHATRAIDLENGIVGPLGCTVLDFQRSNPLSRCLACLGSGYARSYDEKLLLGYTEYAVESSELFHPQALKILKGVHRNVLVPFFRRLGKEGLWPANTSVNALGPEQRNILLFGYWNRPGHGSFLKNNSVDTNEVASWLRWDGLFAYAYENITRADSTWRKSMEGSERWVICPLCAGTGLRKHTHLYYLAGRSYFEWLSNGTVKMLYEALLRLLPPNDRAEYRKNRLVRLLAPFATSKLCDTRLSQILAELPWRQFVPNVVSAYTNMPIVIEEALG